MSIGDKIRIERLIRRMTLQDVAKKIGVSFNYISKLENEKNSNPSDEIIAKLAQTLDINENELFQGFGKVPLATRQMLLKNPDLSRSIAEIDANKELTEVQEKLFEDKIAELYKMFAVKK